MFNRPRFNFRQVDPLLRENLEHPVERTRDMGGREKDGGLIPPSPFVGLKAEDQKTSIIVEVIFDPGFYNFQLIEMGGQRTGNG
jgi:hypothetical protein